MGPCLRAICLDFYQHSWTREFCLHRSLFLSTPAKCILPSSFVELVALLPGKSSKDSAHEVIFGTNSLSNMASVQTYHISLDHAIYPQDVVKHGILSSRCNDSDPSLAALAHTNPARYFKRQMSFECDSQSREPPSKRTK